MLYSFYSTFEIFLKILRKNPRHESCDSCRGQKTIHLFFTIQNFIPHSHLLHCVFDKPIHMTRLSLQMGFYPQKHCTLGLSCLYYLDVTTSVGDSLSRSISRRLARRHSGFSTPGPAINSKKKNSFCVTVSCD